MLISISEILGKSYLMFKQHWKDLLPYMILLILPTLILSSLGIVGVYINTYLPAFSLISSIIMLMVVVASIVFSIWTTIAATKAIKTFLYNETPADWRDVFTSASHLIWPTFYTSILTALIVLGGSILFIIPGLIFIVWYLFAYSIIIFENKKGWAALRASKALVVGRWWAIAWRWVAPMTVFMVFGSFFQYLAMFPFRFFVNSLLVYTTVNSVIASLLNVILTPMIIAALLIVYFNAKQTPVTVSQTPSAPPQS